nr:MFS_1 [uncultured bacterium]
MKQHWKKNTLLFLSSQTISLFGSSLVQYAITWHITLKTQSGLMMAISIICGFLPMFFISPFAGVWADRYNRKMIIILSDSLIAISTLALVILFSQGNDALWLLFVASAIRSIGSSFQTPAISAFLPQLVPEDKLVKVNAANGSIQALVMLASPMLSGALLTVASIERIFLIDVITAIIAIVFLVFIKAEIHAKALEKQTTSYFTDMKEGIIYIRNHPFIKNFLIFCAIFMILASPVAFLTPIQVTRTYGEDVWRLTTIEITFSIGMMLGGLIMATWGGFKNKIYSMTLACMVVGLCTFLLGVIPNFIIYSALMGIFGASMPLFNTPSTVLLQEKVEEGYLGRVFSVMSMISSIMMPLGMLVFGPVADIIKIEWLLIGTGVLLFILSFYLVGSKTLLEAGKG